MPGQRLNLLLLLHKIAQLFLHSPPCQVVQMDSKWRSRLLCLLSILLLTIIDQKLATAAAIPSSQTENKPNAKSTTFAPHPKPNGRLSSGTDQQTVSNVTPKMSALIGRLIEHRKRG